MTCKSQTKVPNNNTTRTSAAFLERFRRGFAPATCSISATTQSMNESWSTVTTHMAAMQRADQPATHRRVMPPAKMGPSFPPREGWSLEFRSANGLSLPQQRTPRKASPRRTRPSSVSLELRGTAARTRLQPCLQPGSARRGQQAERATPALLLSARGLDTARSSGGECATLFLAKPRNACSNDWMFLDQKLAVADSAPADATPEEDHQEPLPLPLPDPTPAPALALDPVYEAIPVGVVNGAAPRRRKKSS